MIKVFENKPEITGEEVSAALDRASEQVERNLPGFTYRCQNHSSANNFYPSCENDQWTCGFWPGQVWLAYEHTGNKVFEYAGLILAESFLRRIKNRIEVDHHDMGFLYTPACVSAYKLTRSERAREAAILAAEQLISRFQPVGEFIQAWGALGAADNYRYIIDCLMNLPLLYWAGSETGNGRFIDIARRHMATCLKYSIRENGSTFHTVFMDATTGQMSHGATCQGYRDDSDWARGQAWALYGLALSCRYEKNPRYPDYFRKAADFYLARLPEDLVPYWDMIFTEGTAEPRDSSSASIAACGFLEMAKYVPEGEADVYKAIARQMMKSLVERYSVKDASISNGQVLHATYSKKSPYNTCTPEGVDECVSWGDYFYMEALTRLHADWNPYW